MYSYVVEASNRVHFVMWAAFLYTQMKDLYIAQGKQILFLFYKT